MSILPADIYLVINKSNLCETDRQILNMLYQPIIGFEAVALYYTLWSDLDKCAVMSNEYTHHHIMNNMKLPMDEIIKLRKKLEAIGLLKTYVKGSETKDFVYELYAPISEYEFFNHPILSVLLYNNLGEKEYKRLANFFKAPKITLEKYKDVTSSFKDVFEIVESDNMNVALEDIRKRERNSLNTNDIFDFEQIEKELKNQVSKNVFTNSLKRLIANLSLIYNIDETHMINLLKTVADEKGIIDEKKLRKNALDYYKFESNGKMPSIIMKNSSDFKKENIVSKKDKLIYIFETTSPYEFLVSKYKGTKPTTTDVKLLESLVVDQGLKPGVVNVLIDYVLKINNQKLTKSFVETIAGQWKRLNIDTAEKAMEIALKEHGKKKTYKKYSKKEEKLPEWFDKKIDKKEATTEDMKEIEELMNKY